MLPLLAMFVPPPLAVEIVAPNRVRSGEAVHVVAYLVNRSDRPVVIVKPDVPFSVLGMGFGGHLYREDKPLLTGPAGLKAVQWTQPWSYGPEAFQTLKSGERAKIEDVTYERVYATREPRLKSEVGKLPTVALAPGEYTLRFGYRFQPEFHRRFKQRGGLPPLELTEAGRTLYRKAWTGNVEATAILTVA